MNADRTNIVLNWIDSLTYAELDELVAQRPRWSTTEDTRDTLKRLARAGRSE